MPPVSSRTLVTPRRSPSWGKPEATRGAARRAEPEEAAPDESASSRFEWLDVTSDSFLTVMGVVIILNAVLMGIETDFGEEHFVVFEHIFCWIYLCELFMNLSQLGCGHFKQLSNTFDLVLVVVGTLDLYVLPHLMGSSQRTPEGHRKPGAGGIASTLRLLRMMRILRVLRLFKMFKSLAVILSAFMRAIHIVMWVALLTIIIDYVCAIFLTRTVGHQAHLWGKQEADVLDWFGTIPRSMRTLFIIMTLAEWDTIALTLCEQMPSILVFSFFIFYIMVASYTMVSLITGILSEALADAQKDEKRQDISEVRAEREALFKSISKTFAEVDLNTDMYISADELLKASEDSEFIRKLVALDIEVSKEDFVEFVDLIQEGQDSKVPLQQFVEVMGTITGGATAGRVYTIKQQSNSSYELVCVMAKRVDEWFALHDSLCRKVDSLCDLVGHASVNDFGLTSFR